MGMKSIDEVGNRYGKLLVIEKSEKSRYGHGTEWLCICDCGKEVVVRGTQLRKGSQNNCGCSRTNYIDIVGEKYGKLTVLKRVPGYPTKFLCQCDCGNQKVTESSSLRRGFSTSCGCGRSLPRNEGSFRAFYRYTKYNAKYRKYEFSLDIELFKSITSQNCHYCGVEPKQIYHPDRSSGSYVYNGIDRVDNSKGYIPENVVPCCKMCNYMKKTHSVDVFKEWIVGVYNHWASR